MEPLEEEELEEELAGIVDCWVGGGGVVERLGVGVLGPLLFCEVFGVRDWD